MGEVVTGEMAADYTIYETEAGENIDASGCIDGSGNIDASGCIDGSENIDANGSIAERERDNKKESRGISGSTLKLIAVVTMLIDHVAASILAQIIFMNPANYTNEGLKNTPIVVVYVIMRCIGRIAFPIYIFLLLEGFRYTRNRWRYLGRLVLFALISEIPFDMALAAEKKALVAGHVLEFGYQNVFFTLAIGLLTITLMDKVWECKCKIYIRLLVDGVIVLGGMALASLLCTDYDSAGVLAIVAAYALRRWRILQMAGLCIPLICSGPIEAVALLDVLPVSFYDGRRGWNLKWIFYAFYPVHLLILGIIRWRMLL